MYAYAAASLQSIWYTGARLIDWTIIKAVGRTICTPQFVDKVRFYTALSGGRGRPPLQNGYSS